jgi:hypothetical protein
MNLIVHAKISNNDTKWDTTPYPALKITPSNNTRATPREPAQFMITHLDNCTLSKLRPSPTRSISLESHRSAQRIRVSIVDQPPRARVFGPFASSSAALAVVDVVHLPLLSPARLDLPLLQPLSVITSAATVEGVPDLLKCGACVLICCFFSLELRD